MDHYTITCTSYSTATSTSFIYPPVHVLIVNLHPIKQLPKEATAAWQLQTI